MIVFDNSNFEDENVKYLCFSNNFKINLTDDKIKVILGPNGAGKTSIYKCIKKHHPNFAYIDYEDVESSVLGKGNELVIGAKIALIEEKKEKIKNIADNINVNKIMKDKFGITTKTECKKISSELNDFRMDTQLAIENFKDDKISNLCLLEEKEKILFGKYGKDIIQQAESEIKVEHIKMEYREKYLQILEKSLTDDETICPICGTDTGESVKKIIKKLLDEINVSTDEITKAYIEKYPNDNPNQIAEKITKIRNIIKVNKITTNELVNFLICGGSKENITIINESKETIKNLKREIDNLNTEKEKFYNTLKICEENIREIFENQLNVPNNNIDFDDIKNEVRITLERNIETYSTGEINLITLIASLMEFMNSDKDTLIIDDPLSSYDIPNQYRIIYEIAYVHANQNSKILIFTHNIDCINITNSQNNSKFEYESLDKIKEKLYINSIGSLPYKGFHISYIIDNLNDNFVTKKYLKLLAKKDELDGHAEEHKIFHYDGDYTFTDNTEIIYRNTDLVDIIDNINDNINNQGVIINSANKVLYLAAMRVWIEKKLYDNCDNRQEFINKKLFVPKINYCLDRGHWNGNYSISKSSLMRKKVMLNQNEHSDSQKDPFYFALSISTDDILREIKEIKRIFEN